MGHTSSQSQQEMQKFCNVCVSCVDAAATAVIAALATLTLSVCHSMDSCYHQLSPDCAAVCHTLVLHFFVFLFPSKIFFLSFS